MCCENCVKACPVFQCYSNITIGKIALLNTPVNVYIQNVATGRNHIENVTSSASGLITLPAGTWNEVFMTGSDIKIWVNNSEQITPYINATEFDTNTYDCVYFQTEPVFEENGYMYNTANQKLIKAG